MMASDGVSKFFIVYHERGSMHFDGCKTLADVVERAVCMRVGLTSKREDFDAQIREMRERIDQVVAWRDEDDADDAKIERKP